MTENEMNNQAAQTMPAKFRKKPVVIEAVQWFPGVVIEGVEMRPCFLPRTDPDYPCPQGEHPYVRTLEGDMSVSAGDWIITGVKGERYPCKPDIFAATYDPVDRAPRHHDGDPANQRDDSDRYCDECGGTGEATNAALSQTAGVPDGWKLVPVEPTEVMCEAAMSSLGWTRSEAAAKTAPITPASPMMEGSMKVWSAMLAAAPAASGAHLDALPDGTLSKSTAKRLAAASVSERARALMAQAYRDGGYPRAAGTLEAGVIDSVDSCALSAIEQALTQQRGEGALVQVALRNLPQYIGKASFSSSVDKQAALNCVEVLAAALTEAKQQGPWEAVPAADGWEDWNDGDSSFLSVADSDARYAVSFAIHEGHSGVWRAYFNPDTEREPIKETHLGTFASKERAKKECEDHCNRAGNYRDNDGGVPYVY